MAGYPDTYVIPSSGPTGPPGPQGPQGLSAYEVALENGFVGTEEEWLASLVGPQGEPGDGGGGAGNLEAGPGISITPGTEPGYTKLSVKSTFPFFDTNGSENPIALKP